MRGYRCCWVRVRRMTLATLMKHEHKSRAAKDKEGNDPKDLLDQLRHGAWVRDQRMVERMAERDAAAAAALANTSAEMMAKLESLLKSLSASVDMKIQHLFHTMDGKMVTLEQMVQEGWKTFEARVEDADEKWKKQNSNEDKTTTKPLRLCGRISVQSAYKWPMWSSPEKLPPR